MKYTITWMDEEDAFKMGEVFEEFIGEHLDAIAEKHNIKHRAGSESELLSIIRSRGIQVDLLEEDGSEMIW